MLRTGGLAIALVAVLWLGSRQERARTNGRAGR